MLGYRGVILLVLIQLVLRTASNEIDLNAKYENEGMPEVMQEPSNKEYLRHILAMLKMYQNQKDDDQTVIETNALINTKYRTWKRNADLINSLLSLPKALNDAGR